MENNNSPKLEKKFFDIQNINSSFNQYYHMDGAYSAVIETYRSDLESPYFKFSSFSPASDNHSVIDDPIILSKMENRPLHQHDFFEIMFVLQGEAVVKIEDTQRLYPAGTGCIVNCNLRHVETLSHDFRIFFLNLSKEYINFLFGVEDIFKSNNSYSQKAVKAFEFLSDNVQSKDNNAKEYMDFYPIFASSSSYDKLYSIADKIISTTLSPSVGSAFFIHGYICQFLQLLSEEKYYHLSKVAVEYGNDFLIFSKLTHLLENSNGRLSRNELSEHLSYSGDYLNRIAKKYTGMSLFEYGTTFTIRKAEQLLLKTDMTIGDIISSLSFSNKSHFYKLFYDKNGLSPKEYRYKYRL